MIKNVLFILICLATLTGCFDKDIFPDTPKIAFEDIKFIDTQTTDSLVLSFSFEDGNGDIGLEGDADVFSPYHIFDVIIDNEDSVITIGMDPSSIVTPIYKAPVVIAESNGESAYVFFPVDKVPFADEDNRPPYDCDSYEIIESDTFYVARNEFHNNFHVEFEVKVGEDEYEPIDFGEIFEDPRCGLGDFDARIPFFDPDGKSGTISYAILSQLFTLAFQDDIIRLKFYIYDRALNKSNEVTTPDFILADITR